jgi:hypothetical protein
MGADCPGAGRSALNPESLRASPSSIAPLIEYGRRESLLRCLYLSGDQRPLMC